MTGKLLTSAALAATVLAVAAAAWCQTRMTPASSPAAPAPATSAPADLGYYGEMAATCKLSDEQAAKLAAKVAEMNDAMKAFWKDNQEKLSDLTRQKAEATKARDTEKAKKAQADIDAIFDQSKQLHSDSQAKVYSVLSAEQRVLWEASQLQKDVATRYGRVTFDDDQKKKIDDLCAQAAQELSKLKPTDFLPQGEVRSRLFQKVNDLLTPEQRQRLPRWAATTPSSTSSPADRIGD